MFSCSKFSGLRRVSCLGRGVPRIFARFASGSKGHGQFVCRLITVIIGVIIWLIGVTNLLPKSP